MTMGRINVYINDYDLLQYCWRCANGNPAQAKEYYDWANEPVAPEEKAVRNVALQDCKYGNPIDYYNWISPYAETLEVTVSG